MNTHAGATAPLAQNPARNRWDMFRYFLGVARAGSLARAAVLLGESQPTVSRRISELETQLGARLLERRSTGIALTDQGRRILAHIEKAERELMAVPQALSTSDECAAGPVNIAAPSGFGTVVLAPALGRFARQYPEIEVDLRLGTSKVSLPNYEADIALRIGDPMHASLVGRRLGAVRFSLYASTGYLAERGRPETPSDLVDHDLVTTSHELGAVPQAVALERLCPIAKRWLRTNSIVAQAQLTRDGMGIAPLPRYIGAPDPGLVEVLPEDFEASEAFWLLTRRDVRNVLRVRLALDFMLEIGKEALER